MEKLIIKFNNGNLAILCSGCSKILKVGYQFTPEELDFAKGVIDFLPPQYCSDCQNKPMKGKLIKKENTWYVMRIEEGDWETYYPLHPTDVDKINEDSLVFDNIEARISNNPEVEFILSKVAMSNDIGKLYITDYAKLITKKD